MKRILTTIVIFLIPVIGLFSQSFDKLFPDLPEWDTEPWETVYTPDNLWDLINGAADAYLSYGFVDLHIADYVHDDSETVVTVELYRHSNPSNAYGIYTAERNPDYHFIDVGLEGYQEERILNFLTGVYYVKILTNQSDEKAGANIQNIARAVDRQLGQKDGWPELTLFFPESMAMAHTDHFIASNFMGYAFMPPAFEKKYCEKDPFQVFILDAGGNAKAEKVLELYQSRIGEEQAVVEKQGYLRFDDPYNGPVWMYPVNKVIIGARDFSENAPVMEVLKELSNALQ